MKTNIFILIGLINVTYTFAQIPSISEKSIRFSVNETKQVADNTENEKITSEKLQDELEFEKNPQFYNYSNYFNLKLEKINSEIKALEKEQRELSVSNEKEKIDSLKQLISEKELQIESLKNEKNSAIRSVSYKSFLPSLNTKYRSYFFQKLYNNDISKTNYLNSFSLSGNKDGISAQSEILADNVWASRVTVGTVIEANNKTDSKVVDETKTQALERLVNGGGNFYLDFALPILTTIEGNNIDMFTGYIFMNVRGASAVKGFGNDLDNSTANISGGLNIYGSLSSESKLFSFFLYGNVNYCRGSEGFYKELEINHNKGFVFGKMTVGVTISNKFKIVSNLAVFGSESNLRREKVTFGIQLLPDFNK